MVDADRPVGAEELGQRRREVRGGEPVQIEQRQHLGDPRGLARPGRKDRRGEPLPLTGRLVGALVVDPRRAHRHRTRCRGHLPRLVVAVADNQPVTRPVELVDVGLDVAGDLGGQRRGQHLSGTIAHDLIEQRRPARLVGLGLILDYLEHGRTFPNQRVNAGPDQSYGLSDHPREGALLHVTGPRAIHRF